VARQKDPTRRRPVVEDPTGQTPGQPPGRPAAFAEDAVVAGGMARRQGAQGSQEVADGPAADGQNGGQSQNDETEKGGSRKSVGEGVQEGAGRRRHGLMDALEFAGSGLGFAPSSPLALA